MLHVIHTIDDPWIELLKSDPVRPEIPWTKRVSEFSKVLVLLQDDLQPKSVLCISFGQQVPQAEEDLFNHVSGLPTVATLYTIWSLSRGGGRDMIDAVIPYIRLYWPSVESIVTLSPPTEMARSFHLANGARELRVNPTTVNFIYPAA